MQNPFIPLGAMGTAGCLMVGLVSFVRKDSAKSQTMMRGRIAAQGFTVIAMCIGKQTFFSVMGILILIHISGGLLSILIFIKHFLFVLRLSKTFVFFLRTSGEYSKKYRQGSVISTDP
jgi:hypothetical protein